MPSTSPSSKPVKRGLSLPHWNWWFVLAGLMLVAIVRLRLLDFPLERDEGEYAYSGQLILQGIPPYELSYSMKFPGTDLAYAFIMALFGETPAGIHFGVLCLTTGSALMLYWLGKKMVDEMAGVVAAVCFVILAASPFMLGLAGHATHFAGFFVIAGLCLMIKAKPSRSPTMLFSAGIMFGLAILMKQHAAIIAAWACAILIIQSFRKTEQFGFRDFKGPTAFCAGVVIPLLLCGGWLMELGVFSKFWFWTFSYAREYASLHLNADAPAAFKRAGDWLFSTTFPWWPLAGMAVVWMWIDRRLTSIRFFALSFLIASALTVVPGLYFRKHYFLLVLPAVALLLGCTISSMRRIGEQRWPHSLWRNWPLFTLAFFLAATIYVNAPVWFEVPLPETVERVYGSDAPWAGQFAGKMIAAHSSPSDKLVVLGSEPEIYFTAHRHSGTGYIYVYPLMESQPFARRMQDEMIREIETNAPAFIVYSHNPASWMVNPDSDQHIFNWWDAYQTNYTLVGIVDSADSGHEIWGKPGVAAYGNCVRGFGLAIYQRKAIR